MSAPLWTGVVMIERPDMTKVAHEPFSDGPMCKVRSVKTLALDGRRAISCELPYRMLERFFLIGDDDHCFVWADVHRGEVDNHLELKERACLKDWVEHSHPLH